MQFALHELLESELKETLSKTLSIKGNALLMQLEQEMIDRSGILMKLSSPEKPLNASGIDSIDYLLSYMHQKCVMEHITLEVSFLKDVSEMLKDTITEANCLTILADLLENALMAIKSTCKNGHIRLEIGRKNDFYEIHIWDDGVPFEKEVLFYLGKKYYTTHKKEGGSGIGLLNTYSLLENYLASLMIDERFNLHPIYSKKISIIFNQKQQYYLLTQRSKEELQYLKQRNDLIIIEK